MPGFSWEFRSKQPLFCAYSSVALHVKPWKKSLINTRARNWMVFPTLKPESLLLVAPRSEINSRKIVRMLELSWEFRGQTTTFLCVFKHCASRRALKNIAHKYACSELNGFANPKPQFLHRSCTRSEISSRKIIRLPGFSWEFRSKQPLFCAYSSIALHVKPRKISLINTRARNWMVFPTQKPEILLLVHQDLKSTREKS